MFCTKCGRKLEDGEVCTCTQNGYAKINAYGSSQQQTSQQRPENQQYRQLGSQQYSQAGSQQTGSQQYQQAGSQQYSQAGSQQYSQAGNQPGSQQYQQAGSQQYQQAGSQQYQQAGSQQYSQPGSQQYQQTGSQQYQQAGGQQYQQPGGQQYQQNGGQQYYQQTYGNPYNNQGMTREAEWLNQKKDAFVSGTKNMFSEILPILKSPVSRVRQIAKSNTPAVGIEFIVTKTVIFLLLVLILIFKVKSAMGYAANYISIPYFKIILLTILLTAGADFLEALLMKGFTAIFNGATNYNAMLSVIGAKALYETLTILVVCILVLISPTIGIVVYAVASLLVPYIEFGGYQASIKCNENKIPYAYFLVKLCMTIVIVIFVSLMMGDIVSSFAGGSLSNILNSLY